MSDKKKSKKFFWNYKNKSYTVIETEKFEDPTQYIPNTRFANAAYHIYRINGFGEKESMIKVLQLFLKEDKNGKSI